MILEVFSSHYDIALSFCTMGARLAAFLQSLPTAYLPNALQAMQEGNKLNAECRSATVGLQTKISLMANIDDMSNVLREMSTGARLETDSPEVESKYDAVCEAFQKFDFSSLDAGTFLKYFDSAISPWRVYRLTITPLRGKLPILTLQE